MRMCPAFGATCERTAAGWCPRLCRPVEMRAAELLVPLVLLSYKAVITSMGCSSCIQHPAQAGCFTDPDRLMMLNRTQEKHWVQLLR